MADDAQTFQQAVEGDIFDYALRLYREKLWDDYESAYSRLCSRPGVGQLTFEDVVKEYEEMNISTYNPDADSNLLEEIIHETADLDEFVPDFRLKLLRDDKTAGRLMRLSRRLAKESILFCCCPFIGGAPFSAYAEETLSKFPECVGVCGWTTQDDWTTAVEKQCYLLSRSRSETERNHAESVASRVVAEAEALNLMAVRKSPDRVCIRRVRP